MNARPMIKFVGPASLSSFVKRFLNKIVDSALSMLFKCTLMAPHGGIFVFPVVGNAIMYLLALVIGTVISTVLLGVLKKPREA